MRPVVGRPQGFTLVELVIVVTVAAILLVIAVPALQDLVRDNRLVTEANNLVAHLNLARSEAIKQRYPVVVCSSAAPDAAVPACDGGTDWSAGWVVFLDENKSGTKSRTPDSEGDILRRNGAVTGAINLHASGGTIAFLSDGSTDGGKPFTLVLCDRRGPAKGREVEVAGVGRAQVTRPPLVDCVP